jgi:L-threonylcarbamoyladenylate synthase
MHVVVVDPAHPDPDILARAAAILRGGGLVAFPTETVYGLGAHALDADAVGRIYAAKGRPAYNPLIVHVADAAGALRVVREWPERARALAEAFWPGPLTMVLPKRAEVPDAVTAGLDSVAVRVPAHAVALALLRAADLPIAAPSANRSTEISPTTARHVAKGLGDRVDLILDGGPTHVGIESTVVDLTGDIPRVLRPGAITRQELASVIGEVEAFHARSGGEAPRASPGMMERHYAPRGSVLLVDALDAGEVGAAAVAVADALSRGERVGAIIHERLTIVASPELVRRLPADPAGYARELYAALHALDDADCDLIVIEAVPRDPSWDGVRDRLTRAAHP